MFGFGFADEVGGGASLDEFDAFDAAAPAFDEVPAFDILFAFVVSAFGEDIGADGFDEFDGGIFVEEHDGIDATLCGEDMGAVAFVLNGSAWAFEASYGGVGIEADDEGVAEAAGFLQIIDVSDVKDIKATVGEDDFSSAPAHIGGEEAGLLAGHDFFFFAGGG